MFSAMMLLLIHVQRLLSSKESSDRARQVTKSRMKQLDEEDAEDDAD